MRTNSHKATPTKNDWSGIWQDAQHEKAVMVAEFHAWLVKTRIETEKDLLNNERQLRETAPFAQAGLDDAETPQSVPIVVIEFAIKALREMELKRKLALLNVYYRQASYSECSESLTIEEGNEAEINELWTWFSEERNGT
jgi:hypothetical protein